jgi:hypothetical protein
MKGSVILYFSADLADIVRSQASQKGLPTEIDLETAALSILRLNQIYGVAFQDVISHMITLRTI